MKFWVVSLGLLLIIPFVIFLWRILIASVPSALFQDSRFVILDYDATTTWLTNLDFVTKTGFRVAMPNDLIVDTAIDKGERKLGDVLTAKDRGWTQKSILWSLGVPVSMIVTEMTLVQRLWWWWNLRALNIRYIDITNTSAVTWRTDADGHKVLVLSPNYEQLASGWFASRTLVADNVTLQLVNTTGVKGLASRYASMANISGIKTGLILSSDDNLQDCVLQGSSTSLHSDTFIYLHKLFHCRTETNEKLMSDVLFKLGTTQAE